MGYNGAKFIMKKHIKSILVLLIIVFMFCGQVCLSQNTTKHVLKTQQDIVLFFEKHEEIYNVYQDFYKNKQFDTKSKLRISLMGFIPSVFS